MLAGLWHAPESGKTEGEQRLGTSTIGSSEACMLGGLALKRRWSVARKKAGKSADKPNLILGINAQVCHHTLAHFLQLQTITPAWLGHSSARILLPKVASCHKDRWNKVVEDVSCHKCIL